MTIRGNEWKEFAEEVYKHIENYTVPQYGDKGDDPATEYTIEECIMHIKKYMARYGKNAREGQQKLDFLKTAHFLQLATFIFEKKN